jgi:hypothetical protein
MYEIYYASLIMKYAEIMYNMDTFEINPDRICLNCRHWLLQVVMNGSTEDVICQITKKHTDSTDSCSHFEPKSTFDDLQDPNRYHERPGKLNVYKRFR